MQIINECQFEDCERIFLTDYYLDPNRNDECDPFELHMTHPVGLTKSSASVINDLSLPSDVEDDLIETTKCLMSGYFQAFGAMARRTLHSVCADKGAKGKDLQEQIDYLVNAGIFTNNVAKRAHDIRTIGKLGAHPEWKPVIQDSAYQAMDNLLWIIKLVYSDEPGPIDLDSLNQRRYKMPKK